MSQRPRFNRSLPAHARKVPISNTHIWCFSGDSL
nr:MAG TPA: hypothetical protein [Caudoviricetes sp.]